MKKTSLRERFSYWFDQWMAKGSLGLIRFLILVTLSVIAAITLIILFFGLSDAPGETVWDSFATVVNAWMPYAEDGDIGYRILMAIGALAGLLVTSVLIGIFSSAIEEKITALRLGNSRVLEEGHTVILGFRPGEYTLLKELILAENGEKKTIVTAGDTERDEMEELILENVEIPENIKVICRKVDLYDPKALLKCAVDTAEKILVCGTTDAETTRILLAVSSAVRESGNTRARISAVMEDEAYVFPDTISKKHNIRTLCSGDIVARIIARSCTEPGLSEMFRDIFNFAGSEFYINEVPAATGLTFGDVFLEASGGVPVGIYRDEKAVLFPDPMEEVRLTDELIVFAENTKELVMESAEGRKYTPGSALGEVPSAAPNKVLIAGDGRKLSVILSELPENVVEVLFTEAGDAPKREDVQKILNDRGIAFSEAEGCFRKKEDLRRMLSGISHVILLSDRDLDDEDADTAGIFRILALRDIRASENLAFSITAEMRLEQNQDLLQNDDGTDFIVDTDMSSYFLAQLCENHGGCSVLREILSNKGKELHLMLPEALALSGTMTVAEVREAVLQRGALFLGTMQKTEDGYENIIALSLSDEITFTGKEELIVIA